MSLKTRKDTCPISKWAEPGFSPDTHGSVQWQAGFQRERNVAFDLPSKCSEMFALMGAGML